MSDTCVIQWKSKLNGRAGRGTKVFARQEAERLVEELNREYPDIDHQVYSVAPPAELPSPQTETSEMLTGDA